MNSTSRWLRWFITSNSETDEEYVPIRVLDAIDNLADGHTATKEELADALHDETDTE